MGSLILHSNILIIITIIQSHHCWSSLLCQSGFRPAITLSSLSLPFWIITASSVWVSACYQSIIILTIILSDHCSVTPGPGLLSLYYHYHYHSGSLLLSQSGSRPAITLLSLSLSFWVITAQSLRVSACYHSLIIIIIIIIVQDHHCLVSPGLCLLSLSHLDLDSNNDVRSDVMSCIPSNWSIGRPNGNIYVDF